MGAFQSGFQMGGSIAQNAMQLQLAEERLQLEREAAQRAAEKHGLEVAGLRRVDDATSNLANLQRLGVRNQEAIDANNADFDAAVEATGRGLAMPKAAPMQQEYRPASDMEINRAAAGLAAAKGDVAGLETLRTSRKGIEYETGYKKHLDDWNKMDDEARSQLINKLSLDSNVKGFGSWVPGKGKQQGYMNYLPPGGDPIKLSANEARELYALGNLMEVDPMRARTEMEKVSDKVRAVAAQAFEAQTKGVTANNTAVHYGNQDAADATKAGYYAQRGQMDRMGAAQYFTGQDGNQYAAIPTMTKHGLQFETVQVNPTGIKLAKMGNGDTKPTEVKEEGTRVTIGGKLMYADGLGGYVPAGPTGQPTGYLPSQRPGVLKQFGIPDNLQGRLQWSSDGTGVRLGNREYDPRSSEDMKHLVNDAVEYDVMQKRIDESMRQRMNPPRQGGLAFGPKITYRPDPRAPSIYAGPEEWERYRMLQNQP